ncbi:ABC transporter ATP-binding protein [Spirochaetia bacterium]|nr:ABC transporter ATP-binding protein [Spirochaetia bacterium]
MKSKKSSLFPGLAFLARLYIKHSKSALCFLAVYCLLSGVLPFASIVLPKFILDELMGQRQIQQLALFAGALVFCVLFGNTLINSFWTLYFLGSRKVQYHYSLNHINKLVESDLEKIEASSFMDIVERAGRFIMADGDNFGGVLKRALDVIAHVITLAGIISIISLLNPLVVIIFVALTAVTAWVNSSVKKANIQLEMDNAGLNRVGEYYSRICYASPYIKESRINVMGAWLLELNRDLFGAFQKMIIKTQGNTLKAQIVSNVMTFFQQGIAYGYLIFLVLNDRIGIGSFTMYLAAVNQFSGAMFEVMNSMVDIRRFGDYYDALVEFNNIPKHQREGKKPLKLTEPPLIEFRNVCFRYPDQNHDTLKNINLVITPGEKLSVVGENGAGKTTMTKLLMRFYRPTEGQILLNGVDIQEYDFDEYESMLSVVLQDFALYARSLRDNVTVGHPADDEKIISTLRRSGFGEKFDTLEKGLDTAVYKMFDDSGFEPSGGEGQKIAMARALLKDGPVVILDEPTAALDPRAEYEIYRNFYDLVKGKSAIFISHRLSSSRFCDKVAVFKNGEIAEYGSHDDLMEKKGYYAELFNLQAQFYAD